LDSSSIIVGTVGNRVLLQGSVSDYSEREKATAIAALIAGPENIQDQMVSPDLVADAPSSKAARPSASRQIRHSQRKRRWPSVWGEVR
jgi:hypothetical protein